MSQPPLPGSSARAPRLPGVAAVAPLWRRRLQGLQLRVQRLMLRLHPPALQQLCIYPLSQRDVARVRAALPGVLPAAALPSGEQVLVCWLGDLPVGIGHISWDGPREAGLAAAVGAVPEIHQLHVAPLYRSLGIGARLVARFEQMAAARGHQAVGLGVAHANPRAATLYARLGYRVAERGDFVDVFQDATSGHWHRVPCRYLVKPLVPATVPAAGWARAPAPMAA